MNPAAQPLVSDPADIVQLLDEHHLVVLGDRRAERREFVTRLAGHLAGQADTEVIDLHGERATSLDRFCRMLNRGLRLRRPLRRSVPGVIDALRATAPGTRHQYLIWRDADVMLESDVRLFGRLANALLGVAAEREYVSPDVLVLQRMIFTGGDKLGAYAEDASGQFCSWLIERGSTPFWEVVSCVDAPNVLTYRLDG